MYAFPTSPLLGGGGGASGGSSGFSGRDVIWVDLRFPSGVGNNGTDELPYGTANLGIGSVPDGGTIAMVGGDASAEPGVSIGARSIAFRGFGGQMASGGLTPKLPTLTYAITTGTQRLAFHNISAAIVHSGTAASLTQFYFDGCPVITLTGGTDAPSVYWVGDRTCLFSGAGGAAQLIGGTIDGYTANSGAVTLDGCHVTGNIESPTSVTIVGGLSFTAISITAPSISIDDASYALADAAGVSFSTTPVRLAATAAPIDIGTANTEGTGNKGARHDHGHRLTFSTWNAVAATANATIDVNGQNVTSAAPPTIGNHLTNKTYVDASVAAAAAGLKVKTPPAVALATANQATLSGLAQTIDTVVLNTIGQRVLLIAQTTATQNGIWVVQSGAWTRPTDFATGAGAAQSYIVVSGGTAANAGSAYVCNNASGSDVIDTNNLTWALFFQPVALVDGAGLVRTGNTFDVVAGDSTIVVNANELHVGVIGNANLADNTIALGRLVNASGTNRFLMRKSASAGAWEDGSAAEARTALGIFQVGDWLPVRAATTGNITLSGTQTVDTVALIAGDRCLVKDQSTGSQNGIYVVAAGAWSRATDAASSSQFAGGMTVAISEGGQGNRVAMLTTNDPITIGSTSLTFAMDRVAALGAVAPADVTKSAAAIGTSALAAPIDHKHDVSTGVVIDIGTGANSEGTAPSLARSDHGHRLTFTVVAAVLAAASAAISVNSQRLTALGAPSAANDAVRLVDLQAHPGIPGGSTTQLQYNNAGAFDGASGITVVGSETALAFGGTATTSGDLRHIHGATLHAGRLQSGAGDVPIVRWGVGTNNYIIFGGGTEGVAGLQLEVTTGSIELKIATAQEYLFSASALTMNNNNLVMGTGFASFGSTVASQGAIRAANGFTAWAVNASAADRRLIESSGEDQSFGALAGTGSRYWDAGDGGTHNFRDGNAGARTLMSLSHAGGLNLLTHALVGVTTITTTGTNPSGTGLFKTTTSPGVVVGTRNYDNTGDQSVITVSGDGSTFNDAHFGDGGTKGHSTVYIDAKTQAVVSIAAANAFVFNATSLDVTDKNIIQANQLNASSALFRIRGSGSTTLNGSGGALRLTGGRRSGTGAYGPVSLELNADDSTYYPMVETAHLGNARRVVSLCQRAAISATEIPTNGGDGVVWLGAAATSPTVASGGIGSGGAVLWSENGGAVRGLGVSGVYYDIIGASSGSSGGQLQAVYQRTATVQTTDANWTTISSFPLVAGSNAGITATVTGRQGTTNRARYLVDGAVSQEGGTASIIGTPSVVEWASNGQWDVQLAVSGASVLVQVKGVLAATIEWWVHWFIEIHQP